MYTHNIVKFPNNSENKPGDLSIYLYIISIYMYINLFFFLRGLFLEGLFFGRAYVYHFCFVFLCIRGRIPSTSRPGGGLYSEGRLNGGFFALRFWGAYIWRGLYMEGLIFGILRYSITLSHSPHK